MRSSGLVASGCNNGTYWTVYRSALVALVLISANEKASGSVGAGIVAGLEVPMTPITTFAWVASWNSQTKLPSTVRMPLFTPTVVENGVPEEFWARTTEVIVSPALAVTCTKLAWKATSGEVSPPALSRPKRYCSVVLVACGATDGSTSSPTSAGGGGF